MPGKHPVLLTTIMAPVTNDLIIWQWNCRGFANKKAVLQQHIRTAERKPAVILLQETLTDTAIISGYEKYLAVTAGRGTITLIHKRHVAIAHEIKGFKIEHVLIELIPERRRKGSIFILNLYSSPSNLKQRFIALLRKAAAVAGRNPLIVGGDFTAPSKTWGYTYDTSKGRQLWQDATELGYTLITDPTNPTRLGTSTCRDTTPDLAFVKHARDVTWRNTMADLGSDHMIVEITVPIQGQMVRNIQEFRWTDWEEFRSKRQALSSDDPITDIEEWTQSLNADVTRATKTITTDVQTDRIDSRLAHLIEAKTSILNRWKGQRLNRKLRKKVAELNKAIEEHCRTLCKQQWDELCNAVDGQLHNGKAWQILRHLLDNTATKTHQRQCLARLLHTNVTALGQQAVIDALIHKYLPLGPPVTHADYCGKANTPLDEDFTKEEIRAALHHLNGRSAPGPDGVTNKALRNLDENSLSRLTDYINERWRAGTIPVQWKTAKTVLIPKPGKAPGIENLRPISLTSCVGKTMEHAVLNRVNNYLESTEAYPHTIIGFRTHLSTQDAMLQLKHQILDEKSRSTKAILGLDLESAFDRVSHSAILRQISELNLGVRIYNYIRDFLTGRKAILLAGDITCEEQELGSTGTPQGSVISPMLFNLVMIGLAKRLQTVNNVSHTIYADDITIWSIKGSDGQIETALQKALEVVEDYLAGTGLRCSPKKSELLLYRPTLRGRPPKDFVKIRQSEEIQLHTKDGVTIPIVSRIRVLGMIIESNGVNGETIKRLTHKTTNAIRLLKRVTNRRSGMKEDSLIRLIHSFVICHIAYVASMHNWYKNEKKKINTIIRRAYKVALGLPESTSTEKLLQLGIHNTLDEIAEAQRLSHLERLTTTNTGRSILQELGITYHKQHGAKADIPKEIRARIHVAPVPRNMNPIYNQGRRKARATALLKAYCNDKNARFTDAASYPDGGRFAVVVINSEKATTIQLVSRPDTRRLLKKWPSPWP